MRGIVSRPIYHDLNARLNWCTLAAWSRRFRPKRLRHLRNLARAVQALEADRSTALSRRSRWTSRKTPVCVRNDYKLKLNSYDLGVDIELADALQRIRFEHPEVHAVVVTSLKPRIFCAGANIFMLGTSSHGFKVNFCKFTNETRLGMEDMSATQRRQVARGAERHLRGRRLRAGAGLRRDLSRGRWQRRRWRLPETPLLGVLPGTGGLTRVVDKRKVRRDLADVFSTLDRRHARQARRRVASGRQGVSDEPVQGCGRETRAGAGRASSDRPATGQGITLGPLNPDDRRRHDPIPLRPRHNRSRRSGCAS